MPLWSSMDSGKSPGLGPYMTGVSKNDMLNLMKLPTTNVFIKNRPAHNIWSVAPLTIDLPSGVLGLASGTLFMLGTTIALFAATVVASGGVVIRWLCLALQNLWNTLGCFLKPGQKKVVLLTA
ncbi:MULTISPECIES: DUF4150 domain-containing protein [unclassified Bordetella]|uniref:DUF4150 domain-containing protein n=1 Tax=unclassified Bordetella TaxID=2630031 RepID=UPI00132464C5|nr:MULTISPECIES: DUF4150 domain-containing protein [unclassified Bordetella]MVW73603.1 hypothetical protein [Bordetella sp. 15P40C-2]MVW77736.1 hypothetical protein [Bordetella sp. 02P26C-1]